MSSSVETAPSIETPRARPWREALVLAGGVAVVAGLVADQTWDALPSPDRALDCVVIAVAALAIAWVLRKWRGWPLPTGLALVGVAATTAIGGPLPMLATALLAIAAIAIGRGITGAALALPVGIALVAGIAGWLLPLPVHHQWAYALVFAAIALARRDALREACDAAVRAWRETVATAPRAATLAMLVLLVASGGTWVPTMQSDDLAYHLGLPYQLQLAGRYALDADHQVWALAPWASDVVHGIAQVLAGAEARGAVNLMWLAIGTAGVHRVAALLGAPHWARWAAVGLYASLPMTLTLATGMQTEFAAAAVTLALAAAVLDDAPSGWRRAIAIGALFGILCAMKLMHAATSLPLLALALWRHRGALSTSKVALGIAATAVVGTASYVYAWIFAGNPVLPLLNETFQSPYYPLRDFADGRWQQGFGPLLPWRMTFDTATYVEGYDGALGFLLVAGLGAWCLAVAHRRTRGLALAATAGLVVATLPIQYARYLYPSLVLLVPVLVVATAAAMPKPRAGMAIAATCLLQLAFFGSSHWTVRNGAVGDMVQALGDETELLESFAPERLLATRIRAQLQPGDVVMSLQTEPDALAEFGTHGRTVSWYSARLSAARPGPGAGAGAWVALLHGEGVTDVVARDANLTAAQREALHQLGADRVGEAGPAQWWRLPGDAP